MPHSPRSRRILGINRSTAGKAFGTRLLCARLKGMVKIPMRASLLLPLLLASAASYAQAPETPPPAIAAKTAGMQHIDGYLPLDWDAATGKLYLEIPHLDTDLLYTNSLPYGTGSNDLGLDRGQISEGRIVRFERVRPQGPPCRTQPDVPHLLRRPRRAARRHAVLPRVHPLPASRSRPKIPQRPRPSSSTPPTSSSTTPTTSAETLARTQAGHLQGRPHPLHHRARRHQGLPQEHRGRSHPHLHHRRRSPTASSSATSPPTRTP